MGSQLRDLTRILKKEKVRFDEITITPLRYHLPSFTRFVSSNKITLFLDAKSRIFKNDSLMNRERLNLEIQKRTLVTNRKDIFEDYILSKQAGAASLPGLCDKTINELKDHNINIVKFLFDPKSMYFAFTFDMDMQHVFLAGSLRLLKNENIINTKLSDILLKGLIYFSPKDKIIKVQPAPFYLRKPENIITEQEFDRQLVKLCTGLHDLGCPRCDIVDYIAPNNLQKFDHYLEKKDIKTLNEIKNKLPKNKKV